MSFVTSFLVDEALLSIYPAGRAQLVKKLLTLESNDIFCIKICKLIYFNIVQNGDEASHSIISAGRFFFIENAHNSCTAWHI